MHRAVLLALTFSAALCSPVAAERSSPRSYRWLIEEFTATRSTLDQAYRDEVARRIATHLQSRLRSESDRLLGALRRSSRPGYVDVLVVGAGVHAAIFNATLSKTAPNLRILTVDRASTVGGVFERSGPTFRLNTRGNLLPGAAIQLASLTSDEFASAEKLGQAVLFAHYCSNSQYLLGHGVTCWEPAGAVNRVTLGNGLRIEASTVVFATGMGLQAIALMIRVGTINALGPRTAALARMVGNRFGQPRTGREREH